LPVRLAPAVADRKSWPVGGGDAKQTFPDET
jgi:hypothetical protein